jgi:hypothetical protein
LFINQGLLECESSNLERVGDDFIADLGVVLWKIDNQISRDQSTLSVGLANNIQMSWLSTTSVHAASAGFNGQGWMGIRGESSVVILKAHAYRFDINGENLA